MKFILIIMVLCAGFWFLPSTRKIILENIVKQRTQKAFNKQMQRDLKKFTDEYKKTLKKGERAERELEYALKRRLNKKQWYVFENVTLPHGKGSTQIDLIALSVFGVFVIEVKEFSGKIYTNNTRSWYQYLGGKNSPSKTHTGKTMLIPKL